MSQNPWPSRSEVPVLVILDARHRVEREYLENWLERKRLESGFEGVREQVVLSTAGSPDPARLSIVAGNALPPETVIIPVRTVWQSSMSMKGTTPRIRDLLRKPRSPGQWRAKRILRHHPERARIIVAKSATLAELRSRLRERAGAVQPEADIREFVAGQAALALDVAERRLRGSRYKVPRDVASQLKSRQSFHELLRQTGQRTGRSMDDLEAEADRILKELVAVSRPFWIDVMARISRTVRTLGYDADMVIDREALTRIRQVAREHPTIFLFTHKTHVDAFAHLSVMYENDFPALHTLGGVNMAFAGLGYVTRHAGGIFIRRSFRDDDFYKSLLRQYIGFLMEKRFPLSWAFEGTRSRVGKLMPPRFGLLKYVIEAAQASGVKKLHIVPIAINYDLIGDVADFATEQAGAKKRPESLSWFIGYLRGLRQPMGKIYLDYGTPVVLEDLPGPGTDVDLTRIAMQVGVEVNEVSPMTLPSMISMILLGYSPGALTEAELRSEALAIMRWARARGIRFTEHFLPEQEEQVFDFVQVMIDEGLISRYDDGPETLYAVSPDQQLAASYYRNTTVHFFVGKAIAELALIHASGVEGNRLEAFWEEAVNLRDLFKYEFFYAPRDTFREELRAELKRADPEWEAALASDDSGVRCTQLLEQSRPLVAHATLLPYAEAYRIVANTVARQAPGEVLTLKKCVNACLEDGRQAWLQRRITSKASIGKLLFENGYKLLESRNLVSADDADLVLRRTRMSQYLRDLTMRMRTIRIMAHPGRFQE